MHYGSVEGEERKQQTRARARAHMRACVHAGVVCEGYNIYIDIKKIGFYVYIFADLVKRGASTLVGETPQ